MLLKFLIFFLSILQFYVGQSQSDEITENCIRCLCHARTGCFQLKNCAKYSISRSYWETAGSPTYLEDSPNDSNAYKNCMQNDGCILRTVTGFIRANGTPDCNCDNQISCIDFLATHLHGNACNKNLPANYLSRFNKCVKDRSIQNIAGWSIPASCVPQESFEQAPGPV